MKYFASLLLVCAVFATTVLPCVAQPLTLGGVFTLGVDGSKSAAVKSLVIKRDVATFTFTEGEFYFCAMPGGRAAGAVFVGEGTAALTPPTEIERKNLTRFMNKESFQEEFTQFFILFGDSTESELRQKLAFKANKETKPPAIFQDALLQGFKFFSDSDVLKSMLDGEQQGLFYAQFSRSVDNPYFFTIDPNDGEEVSLQRRQQDDRHFERTKETICQFHKAADYLAMPYPNDAPRDAFKIENYTTDCTINFSNDFRGAATLTLKPAKPNQKWLYFFLYSELGVDSAVWQGGERAVFRKLDESSVLFVKCDAAFTQGQTRTLNLYYHGNLIEHDGDLNWYYLKSSLGWYPIYGNRNKATFEMTFRTPATLQFISVGEKISTETKNDVTVSRWQCKTPIRNASFNIGTFREYKIDDPRIPSTTVWMTEGGHGNIGRELAQQGIGSGANMEKQVGADVANSLAFFEQMYGKCITDKFYATEIPYSHGEAFAGLIHLYWGTFQRTDRDGSDELFRAHEVAHQWWGIGVDFKTYHDQWLSEGFAEYSGLWYMQAALKDNGKFFDMLRNWKESILGNRQFLFGKGQEAGPIWMGRRTSSSTTRGDYDLIIYKKGAWVLHMLRNMLIDLKTMKEDRFTDMMKEFYTTYAGKAASTEDFQKIVEKHAGMPMDWFFKQWIYETAVPKYQFGYTVASPNAEGKYQVSCRIAQLNVPTDFQMYVPVKIDFGGGKQARLRVLVKGDTKEITLPLLPLKPERITFNDLESVLCEVENLN